MMLGMKFAPSDGEMFLKNVSELEKDGVEINGFELQVLKEHNKQMVLEALDLVRGSFKFSGLHPPFPLYADSNYLEWEAVSAEAGLDYTVLHAAVPSGNFTDLFPAVRNALDESKSTVFLENVPLRSSREGGGSLIETALLHNELLMDIPHTIYNWEHFRRTNIPPEKQVKMTLDGIKLVHTADNDNGFGKVPVNGGSVMFKDIMRQLFEKKDIMLMAEPTGGHLNKGEGHKETCREIWKLWETF